MSSIYKVSRVINNKVASIIVYIGNIKNNDRKIDILELQNLFKTDPDNEIFKFMFSDNEIDKIKEDEINVYFSNDILHKDDTIETIKKKIIKTFYEDISFESIYLFCKTEEKIDSVSTYQLLTQNGKIELTQDRFYQFLSNIGLVTDIKNISDKEIYTYDDILNLDLENKDLIINKPVGQHFVAVESTYPYTVNPFNALFYDNFLEKHANELVTTSNKNLLLDSGKIYQNTLFLCVAHDVLEYAEEMSLSSESTINIYFPYLSELGVKSYDEYLDNEQELILSSKALISRSFEKNIKNVDMFYEVSETAKEELKYLNKGIKNIEFTIHPTFSFLMPLDIIFKLLHATKSNPLIKFNPGKKQEKIYRLYTEKIATNGKKIPYLTKALILKLSKAIGKSKRVSVYCDDENINDKFVCICEFEDNGDINITATFENAKNMQDATQRISNVINPIISVVSDYLEQSGYKLNVLTELFDKNIEIIDIEYNESISITNNINLSKLQGCVSSIFNIIEGDLRKGIIMQYKRVSNFSEMESQEAFIVTLLNKGLIENDVISLLSQNFNISSDEARKKLAEVVSNLQLIQNTFQNKKFKIKNNPGFQTTINKNKFTNDIEIIVKGINNINYLELISIYLDSIIRITQNIDNSEYPRSEIERLCKEKIEEPDELQEIEDIVAEAEKKIIDRRPVDFVGEKLEFGEPEEGDDILDILFGDEDEDEEEDADIQIEEGSEIELEGGAQTVSAIIGGPISVDNENDSDISFGSEIKSLSSEGSEKKLSTSIESDIASLEENTPSIILPTLTKEVTPEPPTPISDTSSDSESSKNVNEEKIDSISIGEDIPSLESEDMETLSKSEIKEPSIEIGKTIIGPELEPEEEESIKEPSIEIGKTIIGPELEPEEEESIKEPSAKFESEKIPISIISDKPKTKLLIKKSSSKKIKSLDSEEDENNEVLKKDITGMSLANPNPFFKRMETYDKPLFLTQQEGQFKAYSRICPWNIRRQPVILTPEEKEKIDRNHPGSYDKAIEYSTDPSKKFYYICPRYWSLSENTSLTEEEVQSGKYGKVIPRDAKKVPPGASIFEFDHLGSDGKYQKLYPGFVKSGSHPNDYCLPCCFTTFDSPAQKKRRQECESSYKKKQEQLSQSEKENDIEKQELISRPVLEEISEKVVTADDYIKSADKFPLDQNRWGYLPISLQKFLDADNRKCQVSNTNTNLKQDTPCILRHGIEINKNKSFVAAIADLYTEFKPPSIPSINQMIEYIINALNIDKFAILNNGNLIQQFYNENNQIDLTKYNNSDIYKKLNDKTENSNTLLMKIASAYENFILYLRNPESKIDHTFLWDIITTPNEKLFPRGINLVILDVPNDDITGNVRVICPTNHYSSNFFDKNKRTLILYKVGNYYEPLYILEDKKKNYIITRLFSLNNEELLPNLKIILEKIKLSMDNFCKPLPSMPNIYNFKTNINLIKIINILRSINYNIVLQVLNYENKCIGLIAYDGTTNGFVPTYPSNPLPQIPTKLMDEGGLWNNFKITIEFLKRLKEKSGGKILCAPRMKLVEDGLVIGILTETNQTIMLENPEQDIYGDNLPILQEENTVANDVLSTIGNKKDEERIEYIKKIKSETGFYNSFRNTVRILLNSFNNRKLREQIEKIIQSPYFTYYKKLELITNNIKQLIDGYVSFKDYTNKEIFNMPSVGTCNINKNADNYNELCKSLPYCKLENDNCILEIPTINLINGLENDEVYITRMADELIRYNRIRSFIFKPKNFLSFGEVGYNLTENEIILLQSLLSQDYFDDLIPALTSEYIKRNTYDVAQPILSQAYSDNVIIEEVKAQEEEEENIYEETVEDVECSDIKKIEITSKWKEILPYKSFELEFPNNPDICTFECILNIIKDNSPSEKSLTKYKLKEVLMNLYENKYGKYLIGIYRILNDQGKRGLSRRLISGEIKLSDAIMSEDYYVSNLDFLVLAENYGIPLVFYSATKLIENNEPILILDKKNIFYYFVKSPGIRTDIKPNYRIAVSMSGSRIQMLEMPSELRKMIDDANVFSLENYIRLAAESKKRILIIKKKLPVAAPVEAPVEVPVELPVEAPVEAPIAAKKTIKKLIIKKPSQTITQQQEPVVIAEDVLKEVAEELPAIAEEAEIVASEIPKKKTIIIRKPKLIITKQLPSIIATGNPVDIEAISLEQKKIPTQIKKKTLKIIKKLDKPQTNVPQVILQPIQEIGTEIRKEDEVEEPQQQVIPKKKLIITKKLKPQEQSQVIPIKATLVPALTRPQYIAETQLVKKKKTPSPNKTRKSKSKSPEVKQTRKKLIIKSKKVIE